MIKFFRKIRQKLLSENKFSKYLLYAIGEIVLVVIGILIALQINNWNENTKAQLFEENILTEIHKTLNDDLIFFERLEKRIRKKDTAIDNLLLARNGKIHLSDTELRSSINWYNVGIVFSYNKGPYEALKSSGLDKIKTDSLRFALTNYYEVWIPRADAFFEATKEKYKVKRQVEYERLENLGFYEDSFEFKVKEDGYEGYQPKTKLNLNKYTDDVSFNKTLLLESNYKLELWETLQGMIKMTETLRDKVKRELTSRFNLK